jgi:RNA polymerase sigma factor (sigma-70 family)
MNVDGKYSAAGPTDSTRDPTGRHDGRGQVPGNRTGPVETLARALWDLPEAPAVADTEVPFDMEGALDLVARWVSRRVPAADVEDVVQDVILALLQRSDTAPVRDVTAFLRATARNLCAEFHRRRNKLPDCVPAQRDLIDMTAPRVDPGPQREATSRLRRRVRGLLPHLPPRQQRVARAILAGVRSKRELACSLGLDRSDLREVLRALWRRAQCVCGPADRRWGSTIR